MFVNLFDANLFIIDTQKLIIRTSNLIVWVSKHHEQHLYLFFHAFSSFWEFILKKLVFLTSKTFEEHFKNFVWNGGNNPVFILLAVS